MKVPIYELKKMVDESIDGLTKLTLDGHVEREVTVATHDEVPEYYNNVTTTNCTCARCTARRMGNLRLLDAPKKHSSFRHVLRRDCLGPKKLF